MFFFQSFGDSPGNSSSDTKAVGLIVKVHCAITFVIKYAKLCHLISISTCVTMPILKVFDCIS